jgi:hypothetical protein
MTTQQRPIYERLTQLIPTIIFVGGVIASFAVMGEKVSTHDRAVSALQMKCEVNERYNSEDHKAILQKLGEIQGTLEQMRVARGR